MTQNLKKDTVSGFIWTALDKIGVQVIQLIVGIITARILSPKDFGLIGALSFFSLLGNLLVTSGFSSALIKKEKINNAQYSAVFFFNLLISCVLYLILYFSASTIASALEMPELEKLSKLIFLGIIINSFGIVQIARLTKEFKFKTLSIANLSSFILTGIITIWMAMNGYSYWAIAWQQVLMITFSVVFLWISHPFRITLKADFKIIKELFSFSSNLIVTGLVHLFATNIYNIIIGKIFKVYELGYYSQAKKYQLIANNVITNTLQSVAFPAFTKLNNEPERQLVYLRKMIRIASFLVFPITAIAIALAEPLIEIVLTEKWLPCVTYFKIAIIGGATYTFHALVISFTIARGKMKTYLVLEITRSLIILATIPFCLDSIYALLLGSTFAYITSYLLDMLFLQKMTKYSISMQIKDMGPYILLSSLMFGLIWAGNKLDIGIYLKTISLLVLGAGFYFLSMHFLGSRIFKDLMSIFKTNKLTS